VKVAAIVPALTAERSAVILMRNWSSDVGRFEISERDRRR
jgi:hypothetical protein